MEKKSNILDLATFTDHIEKFRNYGYTLVAMIFGYELGLFSTLKSAKKPITSIELAELTSFKERYVREWLGSMAVAQIVEVDVKIGSNGATNVYSLSEERYAVVISNVSLGRGIIPCINRFDVIKNCFKQEGPWGDDKAFDGEFWKYFGDYREQTLQARVHRDMFSNIESVLQLKELFVTGCSVLDIGSGSGVVTCEFANRYPKSSFNGFDVSKDAIDEANKRKAEGHVSNINFIHGAGKNLPTEVDARYDVVIAIQLLHNLPDPAKMVSEIHAVLKPAGKLIIVDPYLHSNLQDNIGHMTAAYMLSSSLFYCLPFSLSGQSNVGYGMGWGEEEMLKTVGKSFTLTTKFNLLTQEALYCFDKLD